MELIIKSNGEALPIIEEVPSCIQFETIPIEFPELQNLGFDMILEKNANFSYRAIFLNLKGEEVATYAFKAFKEKEMLKSLELVVRRFVREHVEAVK